MATVINYNQLPKDKITRDFEGFKFGAESLSFLIVEAPPGTGPRLHSHPYEEVFIVQEGRATFTVGDDTLELQGGQIAVVPANTPHKFVNSGDGVLRQIDIHASPRMITTWLED